MALYELVLSLFVLFGISCLILLVLIAYWNG